MSLSARRAWIEIIPTGTAWYMIASLSARRAWIEIYCFDTYTIALRIVALRKESVDRNCDSDPVTDKAWAVALRKESVDRNPLAHASHTAITAAYKRSPASMRATQRKLLELRKRYFESKGGYEKVLERAGLVAPP